MATDVTRILSAIEQGDPSAAEQLLPLVYDELRKLAARKMAQEQPGQTLQATALVHEAYLRLVQKSVDSSQESGISSQRSENGSSSPAFDSRGHFFAAAAEAMRRILVDQARHKLAVRQGGDWRRVPELPAEPVASGDAEQTVIIHDLLDHLGTKHPRQVEVAKLRLFLQMTLAEIAEVMGLSADTAESDWAYARAWLKREWGQSPKFPTS